MSFGLSTVARALKPKVAKESTSGRERRHAITDEMVEEKAAEFDWVALAAQRVRLRPSKVARGLAVLGAAASLGLLVYYMMVGHSMALLWALLTVAFLVGLILMNISFYLFYARIKGWLFVPLVIPLHMIYYLSSSIAFAIGVCLHLVSVFIYGRRGYPTSEIESLKARGAFR